MLNVREAQPKEVAKVDGFYQEVGYSGGLNPSDRLVIAVANNVLLGAHRLCVEQDILLLRVMRVRQEIQRQGIGTAMLGFAEKLVAARSCYCIPYRHLSSFYAQVGFKEIAPDQAPEFLRHRLHQYRRSLHLDVIIMRIDHGSLAASPESGAR
jgi:GNAT superfamily N-acetyltransferase